MKAEPVKIALIQMNCNGSSENNLAKAFKLVRKAARSGAKIIALPELFLGPYFCQSKNDKKVFLTAEKIPGPTTQKLSHLAKELKVVLIGGSIFEKTVSGKYYNTALVFGPSGRLIGQHRKVHIPEDYLYHEQHYFSPGKSGIQVHNTPYGKIAVLICFDQWFPEAARIATLSGAKIIFYPTAIGKIDESVEENITGDWEKMWQNAQLGHAASNSVFVAAINRVGNEKNIRFWGGSFVADPSSKVIAYGGSKEKIVYATCDFTRVKAMQNGWGFLRNRRPDLYRQLTQ